MNVLTGTMCSTAVAGVLVCVPSLAVAIDVHPNEDQIHSALERGRKAAKQHQPPDAFYVRFGSTEDLHPNGFLITKTGALSVMATHMALRGLEPAEADISQVLEAKTMLVSATIFGNVPNFAVDSYMVLDQSGKTIKPVTVRFDAQANRSSVWPEPPRFKAKIVASFNYQDLDPTASATLTIFPAGGGEVTFPLDFSQIK